MTQKITIAIAFIIMAMAIQSCTKDDTEILTKQNNTNNKSTMREGDNTEAKVLKFIDRMDIVREDPNYSGSEDWNYSQDSAVWYIEAALNYKYAFTFEKRSKQVVDSTFIEIKLNSNSNANILDIQNVFDITLDSISTMFNSIEAEHKFLTLADYRVVNITNNSLNLVVSYYFGIGSIMLPDGDWAVAGGDIGIGGIYNAGIPRPYLNYDATDKIEQEVFDDYVNQINVMILSPHYSSLTPSMVDYPLANQFNYTPYLKSWFYLEDWLDVLAPPVYPDYIANNYMNQYIYNASVVSNYSSTLNNETIVNFSLEYIYDCRINNTPPNPYHQHQNFYDYSFRLAKLAPRGLTVPANDFYL